MSASLRVLALEPYFGGSHRAFLDAWRFRSVHHFTLETLPAHHWTWRMRHSAVTFAESAARLLQAGERFDVVFASDMLDVATWRGLVPRAMREIPLVLYMHENQLTYPVNEQSATEASRARDMHFAFTNFTSMLAAEHVWFNSAYHRDEFFEAMRDLLKRMPGYAPLEALKTLRAKVAVHSPGVDDAYFYRPRNKARTPGPLRLVWAARWEHDKGPEVLFAALELLLQRGVDFRVRVLGEQFARRPAVFDEARRRLAAVIERWGYAESREAYAAALHESDVFVSTAHHEFFGIAVLEALAAGACIAAPRALAYPETLGPVAKCAPSLVRWHANTPESVADVLTAFAQDHAAASSPPVAERRAAQAKVVDRYGYTAHVPRLDAALSTCASASSA